MPQSQIVYLLDRINAVVAGLSAPEQHWNTEDMVDVSLEVATFLREALNVPTLERDLVSRSKIDAQTLAEVTEWFASVDQETPKPYGMTFPDGTSFDWSGRIERLRGLLGGLDQAEGLEEIEVGLRLNFIGDPAFASMLMALNPEHEVRTKVEAKLMEKLALLPDDQAFAYWAGLRREVDPSSFAYIHIDPSVAPSQFFDLGDAKTCRQKVATYLARVRPLLVRKMFDKGVSSIPAGQAGIAMVLSWTALPSTRTSSPTDRTVIRALCRFVFCWRQLRGRDRGSELAEALGVQLGGYFIGGRGEQEAKRSLDTQGQRTPSPQRLLAELSKLLGIADQRSVSQEGSVERVLRAYKLGLEVMAREIRQDFVKKKKGELVLQREMLRFLVERSVRAYGTKFGRSEVDLRADDVLGAVVVEVKLLKSGAPSERDINRWLTQLGSYLDQEHLALRGVLVLYNFSSTAIICPIATIRLRYMILAINLCPESPSQRQASIEVVATTDGSDVIRVQSFGDPVTASKTRRRPASRAKGSRPQVGRKPHL